VPHGQKTLIASNFTQKELEGLVIPKATTNFYAPDTNIDLSGFLVTDTNTNCKNYRYGIQRFNRKNN